MNALAATAPSAVGTLAELLTHLSAAKASIDEALGESVAGKGAAGMDLRKTADIHGQALDLVLRGSELLMDDRRRIQAERQQPFLRLRAMAKRIERNAPPQLKKAIADARQANKSLTDIGRCATILANLSWLQSVLDFEALGEADASVVPDELRACVEDLAGILQRITEEETAELINGTAKVATGDVGKGLTVGTEVKSGLAEVLAALKRIEAQPLPGGPARTNVPRAVSKEHDGLLGHSATDIDGMVSKLSDDERTHLAFKLATSAKAPP